MLVQSTIWNLHQTAARLRLKLQDRAESVAAEHWTLDGDAAKVELQIGILVPMPDI